MNKPRVYLFAEVLRYLCLLAATVLAYMYWHHTRLSLNVLSLLMALPMALVFGVYASAFLPGRPSEDRSGSTIMYRHSGLLNISLVLTLVLMFVMQWGCYAKLTTIMAAYIFLPLSSVNYAYYLFNGNGRNAMNLVFLCLSTLFSLALLAPVLHLMSVMLNTM